MQMQKEPLGGYDRYKRYLSQLFDRKPKYIIGSNFGPFQSADFKSFYEHLFTNCTDVCFRDTYSFSLFSHLPQIRYRPDIVFQYKLPQVAKQKSSVGFSIIDLSSRGALIVVKELVKSPRISLIRTDY